MGKKRQRTPEIRSHLVCAFELWAPLSDRVSRSDLHRVPFPFLSTSDVARARRGLPALKDAPISALACSTPWLLLSATAFDGLLLARSCRLARAVPLRIASRALAWHQSSTPTANAASRKSSSWSAHHGRNEPPGVVQIVHQLLPIACICSNSLTMPRMDQCTCPCNGPLYMFSSVLRQVVRIV